MSNKMISIAEHFSRTPAGRYREDGPKSGQLFRENMLIPALQGTHKVIVDLRGVLGFGSSFLEEAFGGLVREGFSLEDLRQRLEIKSDIQTYSNRIWSYIADADARRSRKTLH